MAVLIRFLVASETFSRGSSLMNRETALGSTPARAATSLRVGDRPNPCSYLHHRKRVPLGGLVTEHQGRRPPSLVLTHLRRRRHLPQNRAMLASRRRQLRTPYQHPVVVLHDGCHLASVTSQQSHSAWPRHQR